MYFSHVGCQVKFYWILLIFLHWHLWNSHIFLLVFQLDKGYLENIIESFVNIFLLLRALPQRENKAFLGNLNNPIWIFPCCTQIKLQNRNAQSDRKRVILDNMETNHWSHKLLHWRGCRSFELPRTRLMFSPSFTLLYKHTLDLKTRKFLHFFFFLFSPSLVFTDLFFPGKVNNYRQPQT